jgi:hypothetical protein
MVMVFTPPPKADLSTLEAALLADATSFFSHPEFVSKYGASPVEGSVLKPSISIPIGLWIGLGAGGGGMLLVGAVVWVIIARRKMRAVEPPPVGTYRGHL